MSEINFFIVNKDNDGRRLDNYLFSQFKKGIPKSKIYSSVRKAKIKVNGKKAKPDQKVKGGDKITYPSFEIKHNIKNSSNLDLHINHIKQAIIYESDRFIVVNKPPNYAVHGGSGLNFGIIEIVRMLYKYSDDFNLAHRLDKSTSGCLIIAKKMSALRDIHKQFRDREVKKTYECYVQGNWPKTIKNVENKLTTSRVKKSELKTTESHQGKISKTKFIIKEKYMDYTHMIAIPITGRTHQIRAHCYQTGHPIIGDNKYRINHYSIQSKRLMLHAKSIEFYDQGKKIKIEAKEKYGFDVKN
tara:strand:+ start:300 stop:1199 length:900 start_codon:yes stop_codon:yes gene_type:complete